MGRGGSRKNAGRKSEWEFPATELKSVRIPESVWTALLKIREHHKGSDLIAVLNNAAQSYTLDLEPEVEYKIQPFKQRQIELPSSKTERTALILQLKKNNLWINKHRYKDNLVLARKLKELDLKLPSGNTKIKDFVQYLDDLPEG